MNGFGDPPRRLLYLCTTFPKSSETFIQREVRVLRGHFNLEIVSLWRGKDAFEGLPVRRIPLRRLFHLLYLLPWWTIRRPRAMLGLAAALLERGCPSWLNLQETGLGLGMGLLLAGEVSRRPPDWIHGVWATAPATAALTVAALTGRSFSFGAHAYDLYQDGGDWLLPEKLRRAAWVQTSTKTAAREIASRTAQPVEILQVYRGLTPLPSPGKASTPGRAPRLVSVGRLVEKKGHLRLIRMVAELPAHGLAGATLRLVGEGPNRPVLEAEIARLGVAARVFLEGERPPEETERLIREADFFVFAGGVAASGDRDGLPNVIGEAMAVGTPVVTVAAPAVAEAVRHRENGWLVTSPSTAAWAEAFRCLRDDGELRRRIVAGARAWVEASFDAKTNVRAVAHRIARASGEEFPAPPPTPRRRPEPDSIHVARTDRLGDSLLTLPLLRALRAGNAAARITLLVPERFAPLYRTEPAVDRLVALPMEPGRRHEVLKGVAEPRGTFLELHPDRNLRSWAVLAGFAVRAGYAVPGRIANRLLTHRMPDHRRRGLLHETAWNQRLASLAGLPTAPAGPAALAPTPRMRKVAGEEAERGPYCVLHPGAFGRKPRWPLENFVRLAAELAERFGWRVLLLGDRPHPDFPFSPGTTGRDLGGRTDLETAAGLLLGARLAISRDSGPAHLADALGTPLVCLMGQCDAVHSPRRWRPLGPSSTTLVADLPPLPGEDRVARWDRCFRALAVEEVVAAAERLVNPPTR